MSKGYVYILSNPSMPGMVKIGRTTRSVEARTHELYQTGVPTPFEVVHSVLTPNCMELEAWMHTEFSGDRIGAGREFFSTCPDKAKLQLDAFLEDQIYDLIDEFKPGHVLVEEPMRLDESGILLLANDLDAHPFDVVSAIDLLTADELRPALLRWQERMASVRRRSLEAQSA